MESNHGKVVVTAALSNKSVPLMKKEFSCKYCNKKFSSYQALGGHHNAHKAEREAEKQNKILSNASAYYKKSFVGWFVYSNHNAYGYGFGGKTLGVSPLSMTRFKPFYYMSVTRDYQHVTA
uniref:C2H2-type domain-containing protein n=1 Tax=Glycine max TaxID=3847 RepID=A0A0R0IX20_SOYBN